MSMMRIFGVGVTVVTLRRHVIASCGLRVDEFAPAEVVSNWELKIEN
jgi:hypothetical protein